MGIISLQYLGSTSEVFVDIMGLDSLPEELTLLPLTALVALLGGKNSV